VPSGLGEKVQTNYNGDSCDIFFNIFIDPLFEDFPGGNYYLSDSSPCIDAGDILVFDPDSTITDMGAFWFDQTGIVEYPTIKHISESDFIGATIFRGPLQLPDGKKCNVFDITGRIVEPDKIQTGIYFIEIDGVVTQKVVKVR